MDTRITKVIFDEEKHEYYYEGRRLYGVTSVIGRRLGKEFPDTDTVKLATIYGSDVHKDVENFYNGTKPILSSKASICAVDLLTDFAMKETLKGNNIILTRCEVMVSDFIATASKVDVVMHTEKGAYLFDIKTTSHFDRVYCSLQLSAYKRMYEENYGEPVLGMYVVATQKERLFKILEQDNIDFIFEMNKEKANA